MMNQDQGCEGAGAGRLTRREASAVLGLLPLGAAACPARAIAGAETPGASRQVRYVVTDRRHAASLTFAQSLMGIGAVRLEVTDGLTRLWQEALAPLWDGEGGMVAGLTLTPTWRGLAEQARSAGRRSVLVGHHHHAPDGRIGHDIETARSTPGLASALSRCGDAWPLAMADMVIGHAAAGGRTTRPCTARNAGAVLTASHVLTSWMIA